MQSSMKALAFSFLVGVRLGGGVPAHSKFVFEEEHGLIQFAGDTDLRLNAKGGDLNPGDPLVLWPCSPANHELFDLEHGSIKSRVNSQMCLNAEGGPNPGARIITFPCQHDGAKVDHELFQFTTDGHISLPDGKMCMDVKEGNINAGADIILWPCAEELSQKNQLFEYVDGLIKSKANPDLHLNIHGGEVGNVSHVVLWNCQPAAHEVFEFADERIRLRLHPKMCLNAEGGLGGGHKVILWPCADTPEPNERFRYNKEKSVIESIENPELVFNIEGANTNAGGQLVLWPVSHDEL